MNDTERICWNCKHFCRNIDLAPVGSGSTELYCSEKKMTVGTGMSMCCKDKWEEAK